MKKGILKENGDVPPFYISLNIHEMILHNAMLDSGASHNLMPKAIMESIGLDITKPYFEFYSFDSKKFKCLGLMKDLVITLTQLLVKILVMDVIVANIRVKFEMLLSSSWVTKLKRKFTNGLIFCYHFCFWRIEEIIQRH